MKQLLLAFLMIGCLTSCLKQSIADAMLDSGSPGVATMTYQVNGNTVTMSVKDPDNQSPTAYQLGCSKTTDPGTNNIYYDLDCVSPSGELTYMFGTDSLKVGNYAITGFYGELFVLSYNGEDEYLRNLQDSISFNITSYSQGHISGNFSGRLTPMITAGNPNNTYGAPGSVLITKGSFKNVPVFY
jgi:hypothetical protein